MEVSLGVVELQVYSPHFRIRETAVVAEHAEKVTPIRLRLVRTGTVEAAVSFPPGVRTPSHAIVRIAPLDLTDADDESARAQRTIPAAVVPIARGRIRVPRFPVGESRLEVVVPGYGPNVFESILVDRKKPLDLGTIRFEPGATVQGIVIDRDGEPIAGAIVHVGHEADLKFEVSKRSLSDRDGRFFVDGVTPQSTRLVVRADDHAVSAVDLRLPDDLLRSDPLRVVLQPVSTIAVQLTRGSAPFEGMRLVMILHDDVISNIDVTDERGRFVFSVPAAGSWRVVEFGRDPATGVLVEVAGEAREYPVELEIH
jgi:hypothetical protein